MFTRLSSVSTSPAQSSCAANQNDEKLQEKIVNELYAVQAFATEMHQFAKTPERCIDGYSKMKKDLVDHSITLFTSAKNMLREIVKNTRSNALPTGSTVDPDIYGPDVTYFSLTIPGKPWMVLCDWGHCPEERKVVVSINKCKTNRFSVYPTTVECGCSQRLRGGRYKMEPTEIHPTKIKQCTTIDAVIDEIVSLSKIVV